MGHREALQETLNRNSKNAQQKWGTWDSERYVSNSHFTWNFFCITIISGFGLVCLWFFFPLKKIFIISFIRFSAEEIGTFWSPLKMTESLCSACEFSIHQEKFPAPIQSNIRMAECNLRSKHSRLVSTHKSQPGLKQSSSLYKVQSLGGRDGEKFSFLNQNSEDYLA